MINYCKCFFIAIVIVLSTMTMGTNFSASAHGEGLRLRINKELHLTYGYSTLQEEWNKTFGGVRYDLGTDIKLTKALGPKLSVPTSREQSSGLSLVTCSTRSSALFN